MKLYTRTTARNTDPSTSHDAASAIALRAPGIEQDIINYIAAHGPSTIQEIADGSGINLVTVSPRVAPLRRRGQVHSIGKRKNPSGSMALVWALGPEQSAPIPEPASTPKPEPGPARFLGMTETEWEANRAAYLNACEDLLTVMQRLSIKG